MRLWVPQSFELFPQPGDDVFIIPAAFAEHRHEFGLHVVWAHAGATALTVPARSGVPGDGFCESRSASRTCSSLQAKVPLLIEEATDRVAFHFGPGILLTARARPS